MKEAKDMGRPNSAGVDGNGFIVETGFFPKGALNQLNKGKGKGASPKKPAESKRTSPVTKKGKK